MTDALRDLGDYIQTQMPHDALSVDLALGELTVHCRPSGIQKLVNFLKNDVNCQFRQLIDICGVDYPDRAERFDVVYHFLSLKHNHRIRIKVSVAEDSPVPSINGIFPAAGWFEREAWDLYGIFFSDHPDLRRLLTDYGFEGHPMRKDFPLTGHVQVRYDEEQKRVVNEPVYLTQEFRNFDFESPWEGMVRPALPGDEKATR